MEKTLFEEALASIRLLPKLGCLAVLRGGESGEREVSLKSGQFVFDALARAGANVHDIIIDRWQDAEEQLRKKMPNKVISMLHGEGGEDGYMQSLLEKNNIPYAGSKVEASALCMNKIQTKKVWESVGLKTPKSQLLDSAEALKLPFPLVIKPVAQGSSLGLHIVNGMDELVMALEATSDFTMMAEQYIKGREMTVGIVANFTLPVVEIIPSSGRYDYHAKYIAQDTQFLCPPPNLSQDLYQQLQNMAHDAFKATGAEGWGRIDFIIDEQDQPWFIEINCIPGMTDHSLVPTAAKHAGLTFEQLVALIACS